MHGASHFARRVIAVIGLALLVHLAMGFFKFVEPTADALENHLIALELLLRGDFALPPPEAVDGILDETDNQPLAARLPPGAPTARRMPLYPLGLAGLYRLGSGKPDSYLSVGPLQSVLMVLNIGLIMLLGWQWFGERVALLAGLLAIFYQPYLFYLPTVLLPETLFMTLVLASLVVFSIGGSHLGRVAAAFGLLGLATLTRPNALFILPALLLWIVLESYSSTCARKIWWIILTGCLAFCLPLVPWWVRNAVVLKSFIPLSTNSGWNFYLGHNPTYREAPGLGGQTDYQVFDRLIAAGLSEKAADTELYRRGMAFIREHPAETTANLGRKLLVLFSPHTLRTINVVGFTLVVLGWGAMRRGLWPAAALIAVGLTIWVTQVIYTFTRQRMGMSGLGISFEGIGLMALAGLLAARHRKERMWLLPAVYLSQVALCLLFIPVARIRWTVDFVAILYTAVALDWLVHRMARTVDESGGLVIPASCGRLGFAGRPPPPTPYPR